MEAFSLLKYWRGGGGGTSSDTTSSTAATTTILTAVAQDHGDDGPFFDLEFALPDEEVDDSEDALENPNANLSGSGNSEHHTEQGEEEEEDDDNIEESERELKFTLSPSPNDLSDPNLSLSPSEDLFFKGKLLQVVDPSSSKPQFTASLLKSATKFRVFMSGLKKPKSNTASDKDSNASDSVAQNPKHPETQQPESQKKQPERKLFTVKFKVEEVPIMSLLTRDNSSKGNKSQNHNQEEPPSSSDEKRFSKEVMQKYLKKVKPLYVRVSRRSGDRPNLSSGGKAEPPHAAAEKKPSPAKAEDAVGETAGTNSKKQKQRNVQMQTGLGVVCKRLGKSRSASSAVAAAPAALVSSKRRDDSLLQQQDGIQGAILHCKKSFNASRSEGESSLSDPLHETSSESSRKSANEGKDSL